MALRIRRSITLGQGVTQNVASTAAGARYTLRPSARRVERRRWASGTPPPRLGITAKPGLTAPGYERDFFMGLEELQNGQPELALQRFEAATRRDSRGRALSDNLLAGLIALQVGQADRAAGHLEVVVESPDELPDELLQKYVPESGLVFELSITPEVGAVIPAGSLAATLALVECYQHTGRHEEAVGVLQQLFALDPDPALRLSLCELYAEAEDWDEVVALAAGVANEDDLTLQTLLYLGRAHTEREESEEALAVYTEALSSKRRYDELLKEARYERGRTHLRRGLKDFKEIHELDPGYRDVAGQLARGAGTAPDV